MNDQTISITTAGVWQCDKCGKWSNDNSYTPDNLNARPTEADDLVEVMAECDEYLTGNHNLNSIGAGSILHQKIKEALTAYKGESK